MKRLTLHVVFFLSCICITHAQHPESKMVVSDELHFIAVFPEPPKYGEGNIDTKFGKAFSRRWALELPGLLYEVSVVDFSDLSVKMDYKPLNQFYETLGNDLGVEYNSRVNDNGDDRFGEYGRDVSLVNKKVSVEVEMFLIRQRLYQVKVVMSRSLKSNWQSLLEVQHFLDEFLFVKEREDGTKYSYGLPKSLSQNILPD